MRAALYARFSNDDRQNRLSAEDQLILCRRHAEARGWEVVAEYRDEGVSGAAMANRPGLLGALAAAAGGQAEILLVEAEDRISRNLGHLAFVRDELETAGAVISTLHTDKVELMHVAFMGAGAQQYLIDLGHKTARGLLRNAEKGLATGAHIYGYRSQPGGQMSIVEVEADTVRRIFREFVAGATSREIAAGLNRDGIPGGRGGRWSASSITGSRQRGNGVVRCELYAGVKVYGRMTVTKDHRTGKRRPKLKPPAEWKRTPVPELAILDAELWSRARACVARMQAGRPERLLRKPGVFSGLLRCGVCGGAYTVYNKGRLICARRREQGESACSNRRTLSRALVEGRVLEVLQKRLLAPEVVAIYVRAYAAEWEAQGSQRGAAAATIAQRLGVVGRTITRLVDEICEGRSSPALRDRLAALETEKAELEARGAALEADSRPITFHPRLAEAYAARIERLQARLAEVSADPSLPANRELIDAARGLIERIEITPTGSGWGAPVEMTLHGRLALFMQDGPTRQISGSALVAGGGSKRSPTFGVVQLKAAMR